MNVPPGVCLSALQTQIMLQQIEMSDFNYTSDNRKLWPHIIQLCCSGGEGWNKVPPSYFPEGVHCTREISNPTEDKAGILPPVQNTKTPESS